MLKILETDFKNLFLKSEKARIKKKSSTFEQRISGKGFGKTVFTLSGFVNGQAEKVQIKHPLIRLRIQLDKLNIKQPLKCCWRTFYKNHSYKRKEKTENRQ